VKTVYKYQIPIQDEVILHLPVKAQLLSIQEQNGVVCVWALVDPASEFLEPRCLRIFGTGHLIPDSGLLYVSTFQVDAGAFVFHAFEDVAP
jgi:hypothetical protein